MTDDVFLLYGTRDREDPPVRLKAGLLEVDLVGGNLRSIHYDGVEVLRAIAYVVRDRDWGTYSPTIEDLDIDQTDKGFAIKYRANCKGPNETSLMFAVSITGGNDGLVFEADASSPTGFETNRCGFCILHPITGVAGRPVTVEHTDGSTEETNLPDLIEPWQPFMAMRAITHPVCDGVEAECRMEGDTFEMEDQRNWSDASYKTYVRPLALPWPYLVPANETTGQKVVLKIRDTRPQAASAKATKKTAIEVTPGTKSGLFPKIGVIVRPEDAFDTIKKSTLLSELAPQELLFHFDPLAGHTGEVFKDFSKIAQSYPVATALEIALPCQNVPLDECREIASQMQAAGFKPDAIMISPAIDRQSTPPGSAWPDCPPPEDIYAAAHIAFPESRIGGGMLSYFTELNRKRVPSSQLSFISHCTNPIVHAADDLSIMQTLEAIPFITRSTRAIYGDKAYRIGPSTIAMRQNPYGSRTMDNPDNRRIAMANRDPRHNGKFGKAFAMGYAIRMLDAELECLTLSALTGPFGLVAKEGEPTAPGGLRPIYSAIKLLIELAGTVWLEAISASPTDVLAAIAQRENHSALHLVNLTPSQQDVDLSAFSVANFESKGLRRLDPFEILTVPLTAQSRDRIR
ncbi:D-apionate lactonase [Oryzifoliimicrobium ureilyticus]|uniref:D-apionate lactonase n=1 Tax=Oryzifoliimicrobium ureilyticus TaxID=3113724 RepID=UPI0030761B2C